MSINSVCSKGNRRLAILSFESENNHEKNCVRESNSKGDQVVK